MTTFGWGICCPNEPTTLILHLVKTYVAFVLYQILKFLNLNVSVHPLPLLHKKRVTLQCLNDVMLLAMDLQDIPAIKPSSLHLQLLACQPHHVTETSALFRVPFQGCGTTRGTTRRKTRGYIDNFITYSNVVENSLPLNNSSVIVSHTPKLHYPFSCYYRQKYVITIQEGNENRTGNQQGLKQQREGEMFPPASHRLFAGVIVKAVWYFIYSIQQQLLGKRLLKKWKLNPK